MKHHLHLLLAASFGAMSIGAAAAVHDWTATRIGPFEADSLQIADMNNTGQVALWAEGVHLSSPSATIKVRFRAPRFHP